MKRLRPTNSSTFRPSRTLRHESRRGISIVWILASGPAMITLLCVILEIANLWVARIELANALDAAALSGVKTWGDGGTPAAAEAEAQATAALNTVIGTPVTLTVTDIDLGSITGAPGPFVLNCSASPSCPTTLGVRTSVTVQINSVCSTLFGTSLGPFNVTSTSVAMHDCGTGLESLVRIQSFVSCP